MGSIKWLPMRLSRSLLKLIDEAIIPALLVFGSKLVGLVVANYWYDLSWQAPSGHSLFPLMRYGSPEAFNLANNFSNAVMLAVVFVGFVWVLIRAHTFHESHVSPRLSIKLVNLEMTGLVVNSWEIYHQAVVWLAYVWLTLLLLAGEALLGAGPWWLVLLGGMVAVLFSWLFVVDVEREVEIRKERT